MKIDRFDIVSVPAGWRSWLFLRLYFSDGLIGESEFTESNGLPISLASAVEELASKLIGVSIVDVPKAKESLQRVTRQSSGGITKKAISAIENALWDAYSKMHGKTLFELFGGTASNDLMLSNSIYWSHFPTTRVRASEAVGLQQPKSRDDLRRLGELLAENAVSVFKTNFIDLETGTARMPGFSYQVEPFLSAADIERLALYIAEINKGANGTTSAALDANYNFALDDRGQVPLNALERLELAWLEVDADDFHNLETLRGLPYPICSGENILEVAKYEALICSGLVDMVSIDLLWLGLSDAWQVATLAQSRGLSLALHNYYSDFASSMALTFSNLPGIDIRLLEYDPDDVPQRQDLVGTRLTHENAKLILPLGLGWSNDLDLGQTRNQD